MTWSARHGRAPFSTAISTIAACFLAGCSSSSSAPAAPGGPDGSDGTNEEASAGEGAPGDEAVTGSADAGPDVFASCPTSRATTGAFPADVAQVLSDKCQTCHQMPTKNHAPFPLLTYAETQAADPLSPYTGVPIWQVMHTVIQATGVPHMPFGNAAQLTSAEFTTLDDWLLACALPASVDEGGSDGGGDAPGDSEASTADGSADSSAGDGGATSDAGGQ